MKICAEGGANRLYDQVSPNLRTKYIPEYIVGDLDSVRSEVQDFYRSNSRFHMPVEFLIILEGLTEQRLLKTAIKITTTSTSLFV